jgi:hypothetical protein
MAQGDFFTPSMLESRAHKLLVDFARDHPLGEIPPVPIERIAENFLDLRLLWESIPEPPRTTILAKLTPWQRRITFNENRCQLFETTQFLYNTVLAHEIGHWELHIERGGLLQATKLPSFQEQEYLMYRDTRQSWDEKNAHRFMSYLLMPRDKLSAAVARNPIRSFSDLYRLRDSFQVTVTALRIRLEGLDLVYIDSEDNFYPNRQVFAGQRSLF